MKKMALINKLTERFYGMVELVKNSVFEQVQAIGGCGNTLNRKSFNLARKPIGAQLKIVADSHTFAWEGWMKPENPVSRNWLLGGSFIKYRIFVNGKAIGIGPFRSVNDGNNVLHTFDVSDQLQTGENVLGVFSRGERLGFACILELDYADGSQEKIVSDSGWKQLNINAVYNPVCWHRQYLSQDFKGGAGPGEWAEHIDGLNFPDNWDQAGFDDSSWMNCKENGTFTGDIELPELGNYQFKQISPVSIERTKNGNWLVDFGREVFAGIEMTGPEAGGDVEIRLSETLLEDKRVQFIMQTFNCYQDVWTFRPGGQKLAHFGLRMFRYAEICGYEGALSAENIAAVTVNTPFNSQESAFSCSEETLEKIWQLCKNTIEYTNIDSYVDCLSRERIAYEADSYINMLTHLAVERNTDMARRSLLYQIEHPTWPCEWLQFVIPMVYEYVMASGDLQLLSELYERLGRDFSLHGLRDKLALVPEFPQNVIVDWPDSQRDQYEFGQYCAVPNAFVYYDLTLLAELANLLGKDADCRQWKVLAAEQFAAFNRELFDQSKHLYKDCLNSPHNSLHSSMFAAAFDLVPEQEKEFIGDFLCRKGMVCSVYGSQFLLEALFRLRRGAAAVELMLADGAHGWVEMLRNNATTTFEAWSSADKPNMSKAHPWGSAPGNQIVRGLFGLRPVKPGWEEFTFDPQPGAIKRAKIVVPTVRGFLHAQFVQHNGKLEKSVELKEQCDLNFVK